MSALFEAAKQGDSATVRRLIQEKTCAVDDVDEDKRTALHWSCSNNHPQVAKILLEELGANPNSLDDQLWTPLIIASSAGNQVIVEMLLESGAKINLKTAQKRTALHYACSKGNSRVVSILLEENADVRLKDNLGWTALHRAVASRHVETLSVFLHHDISMINAINDEGNTALHLAAQEESLEMVQLLLSFGASKSIRNNDKLLAYHLCPRHFNSFLVPSEVPEDE